jgi:hypothetical protein
MNDYLNMIKTGWQSFWFRPGSPLALGLCRILFYGMLLCWFWDADFTLCTTLGKIFWSPVSFFRLLAPHGSAPTEWLTWIQAIWKISLVASLLGLHTRLSTTVACVLGIYLIGLPYNLGKINHQMAAVCIGLVVMAVSRCGRVYSLDQLISRRTGKMSTTTPSAEYFWPIQLMRVVICLVFFTAGLNKLRESGLAWITSETLQMYLLQMGAPMGLWLAQWPWLCHLLAAFTIVVEFFHPLALVSNRFAIFWIPAGISLFLGIKLMMGIWFLPLILVHLFWLPWGFLGRKGNVETAGGTAQGRAGEVLLGY